jgi:hypothetical protein
MEDWRLRSGTSDRDYAYGKIFKDLESTIRQIDVVSVAGVASVYNFSRVRWEDPSAEETAERMQWMLPRT